MAREASRGVSPSSESVIIVDEVGQARIGPTPERLAQARFDGPDAVEEIVTEVKDETRDVVRRAATVRFMDSDVLSLLYSRKIITQPQFACGQEYLHHWLKSGLASTGILDLGKPVVDGGQDKPEPETQMWHLGKWMRMVSDLGEVHSSVLTSCILHEMSLSAYGVSQGPYRSAASNRDWAQNSFVNAIRQLEINLLDKKKAGRQAPAKAAPGHHRKAKVVRWRGK